MKSDYESVKKMEKYFTGKLKGLLSKYFPGPTEEERLKNLDDTRDFDFENALSLNSIIVMLIQQTVKSPDQPYIDITPQFYPKHVEILLRCTIALKDPNNTNRMKLVPFHM